MGRYVTGDFDYKYVFAKQGSNLGEVLDDLVNESQTGSYVDRFIGDSGEFIHFWVEEGSELQATFDKFINNFDSESDWSRWTEHDCNRFMVKKLVKDLDLYSRTGEKFKFFSEY